MVGLDPDQYRDRYPKELSGGQAQRVGVARALGADPDIMLMDEPFGAIDPITRERLQNEFLRLQGELRKTIVFVTHDIDEAIKMGDKIAILGERSTIRQIDTPERILAYPVDDFVDDFIGTGSTIKGLNFLKVSSLTLTDYPTLAPGDSAETGRATLRETGREWLVELDESRAPVRWVHADDLGAAGDDRGEPIGELLRSDDTLFHALELMVQSASGETCVVDDRGAFQGVVTMVDLAKAIRRAQYEARLHYEELEAGHERRHRQLDDEPVGPEDITDVPAGVGAEAAPTATRRARAIKTAGLWLAPVMIALLSLLFYLYYRNLEEDRQQHGGVGARLEHQAEPQTIRIIYIAFWSTVIVILVAVPLGIMLTRPALRRISPFVLGVANSGQALPAYGLLVIFLGIMGQGAYTVIVALSLYALLPVLRNTMVGLDGVDRSVIEAGRGMGMTKMQALTRIELPLAVPIIIAGVRTAMILNIGMATLAFLIGGGGLGITIQTGLKLNQDPILIVGAWLVALVALTFDWLGAVAERILKPRGL